MNFCKFFCWGLGTCLSLSAFSQKKTSEVDSLLNTLNDTATVRQSEMVTQAPPVMDKKWNKIRTKAFTLNIGFCMLVDHNILVQDGDNIAQVGEVASATEFRADRLILSGSLLFFKRPWRYMFSANYNGLDAPQGKKTVDMIDWNLEIPIGAKEGWLTIGKQKEGVGLEYIMPGTQGQFMERSTGEPMLVKQRNVGIRYSNSILNQRMTYTAGFFNNYWETGRSFSDNGSQVTARISALPHYVSDRDLVHLGVAYRYTTATEGSLTYKAKPEANTAPSFVSTGSFAADHAGTLMFEGLAMKESVMVMAEYMSTSVRSEALGHPNLWYWQVGAGWFVTGENRRYNRITGNPGKLVPSSNFKFRKGSGPGAIELATRITQTNGTDAGITGGKFTRFTVGVNWFTNAHFRYTLNYGYGQLVRDGLTGYSSFWQFRIQFEL